MTREQLDGLLSEAWLKEMVAKIRDGDEKLKDQLPYICPHYARFKDNHRAQKDIEPEAFTFMTCVDVDDKELVDKAIQRAMEVNQDEYSDWQDQVLRIEYSARRKVHIYIRIPKGMTIEEAQQAFCQEIEVPFDESCITPERFIFVTGKDEEVYRSEHWLEALSEDEISERREAYLQRGLDVDGRTLAGQSPSAARSTDGTVPGTAKFTPATERTRFIFRECMKECGLEPEVLIKEGGRHDAVKSILSVGATQLLKQEEMLGVLSEMMPQNWQDENIQTLVNDFYQKYHDPSQKMTQFQRRVFAESLRVGGQSPGAAGSTDGTVPDVTKEPFLCDMDDDCSDPQPPNLGDLAKKMPQGVKDSIEAVGPQLAMPALVAVAPVIGMLATGVKLDVHGVKNTLNLIAYVAGDFASGKGSIDPLIEAWTHEVSAIERVYQQQMDEWRAKKQAAKNKKDQPEEPKLPIRLLTLNNTVANLAEMLSRTDGRHAFSFTPEADTVAQKWKASVNDFSVMLRQSYDGSKFDREARSAEAVNVHIDHLLWNVTMCGTPDALYRVVQNYTDGFQSRIALARTPDNTFAPLAEKPRILTDRQAERIHQVAHLLPLMQGAVVLPKLEEKGREWLERVRLESMMSDDKTRARQRFRICVTTQRIVCCIMLCRVADQLITQYGFSGAEKELKLHPDIWMKMLKKAQTPQLLEVFNVVADYLMDCALYFFRDRIENAFSSRDYAGTADRQRTGKNDSIFARLDFDFGFEAALQQTIAVKGENVSRNTIHQMLKNWKKQGLIVQTDSGRYKKVQEPLS
jgi:hypothetical protein